MWYAIGATVLAWIAGLFADANIPFEPGGYLELRVILPLLVMGGFLLAGQRRNK